ncbi:MAG TPA: hypothetical protein VIY27_00240 [Myxococcota bacterium]
MATELAASRALPGRFAAAPARSYERRRPEGTTLHTVVREQLESFLTRANAGDDALARKILACLDLPARAPPISPAPHESAWHESTARNDEAVWASDQRPPDDETTA